MPRDANGRWYPKLFQKQLDVMNCYKRVLLVPGPRLSGKTRAVCHKICRHLWETDGARVGMFSRTLKAKDGGTWSLLTKSIIKEWIENCPGFRYTTDNKGVPGPKTDGITRTPFFRIRNIHGTESELMLFSLDDDNDVEAKLKEMEFSMIYFSELDKFGDRRVLTVALPSLRLGHLKFEDMMWIADCNPSEEGEQSWIFKLFFKERTMPYQDYVEYQKEQELPQFSEEEFTGFYGQIDVITILPEENTFIDPRQLQEVKIACGSDAGLYARLVKGDWVWGGGDSSRHFRSLFKPHLHVIGRAESNHHEEWETAVPSENCWQLVTGWDPGETNHAMAIMEKTLVSAIEGPKQKLVSRSHFTVLDELVHLRQQISHEDFGAEAIGLIEELERISGKTFDLSPAWADQSSITKYSAAADSFPHLQVEAGTGGRVSLEGVPKPNQSVYMRVALMKQLLAQQRFHVSSHCFHTIKMLKDLRKGTGNVDFIPMTDDGRHIFDAISYALLMECRDELMNIPDAKGNRSGFVLHIG